VVDLDVLRMDTGKSHYNKRNHGSPKGYACCKHSLNDFLLQLWHHYHLSLEEALQNPSDL